MKSERVRICDDHYPRYSMFLPSIIHPGVITPDYPIGPDHGNHIPAGCRRDPNATKLLNPPYTPITTIPLSSIPPSQPHPERTRSMVELLTRSRFILSIALSIPLTTLPIEFVTLLIVTAVSTLLATASIREANRNRFSPSVFFRIAF